jgi:hypothetical protein
MEMEWNGRMEWNGTDPDRIQPRRLQTVPKWVGEGNAMAGSYWGLSGADGNFPASKNNF